MNFKTGDIVIKNQGRWGHALMCCQGGSEGKAKFIHATNARDFHIDPYQSFEGGKVSYLFDGDFDLFSPNPLLEVHLVEKLIGIANQIKTHAKYGIWRAIRLAIGNSSFGVGAQKRLDKYIDRLNNNNNKLVTTLTCSEAVILSNQMCFPETSSRFIKLDAAHTLPYRLGRYLHGSNSWRTVVKNGKVQDTFTLVQ